MARVDTLANPSVLSRIRRNHGLEHATLHVLSRRVPHTRLAGHSDAGGFWILGDVSLEDVYQSVEEGLGRLRAGERQMALHTHCGTNFVTAGTLAGLTAGVTMLGGRTDRERIERLPLAMLLSTLALIFAQPLGLLVQERLTTSGDPGALRVVEIVASRRGRWKAHRIVTQG